MITCFPEKNQDVISVVCAGLDSNKNNENAVKAVRTVLDAFSAYTHSSPETCSVMEHKDKDGYFSLSVKPRKHDFYACVALDAAFSVLCLTLKTLSDTYGGCLSIHMNKSAEMLITRKSVVVGCDCRNTENCRRIGIDF